jgi:hypothetical protein
VQDRSSEQEIGQFAERIESAQFARKESRREFADAAEESF